MTGIELTLTLIRVVAAVLTAAAVVCWARVGPGFLAAGLFVALGVLGAEVGADRMTGVDAVAEGWLASHRNPGLQADASVVFGYLGRPSHFAVLVVFCGALLALQGRSVWRAVVVVGAVGAGVLIEETLKSVVGRDGWLPYAHAFPSGHVTVWASFLGTVAVCLGAGRAVVTKLALGLLVASGVAAVAFLALYSRAHILTDVVGGMVLGGAIVACSAAGLGAGRAGLPAVFRLSALPGVRFAEATERAAAV